MKKIADIRMALDKISDARMELPPEEGYLGSEPGIETETVWPGESDANQSHGATVAPGEPRIEQGLDEIGIIPEPQPVFEFGAEIDETRPLLKGQESERIRKSVELKGMDALGCYVTFHVKNLQWGVYISTSGIAYLIQNAFAALPVSFETKAHLSFYSILQHELFHFATDYMVSQWEILLQQPLHIRASKAQKQQPPGYSSTEEMLANAFMLKALRTGKPALKIKGKTEALRQFTLLQPEGYRDGGTVKASQWEEELIVLALQYLRPTSVVHNELLDLPYPFDFGAFYPLQPKIDWRYCPIHVVHDEHRLEIPRILLNLFSALHNIQESEQFLSMLSQLSPVIRKKWHKTKHLLSVALTPGADFKKWPPAGKNVYSVRVDRSFRAHLAYSGKSWVALEIGSHSQMGHG
jgi:hypothetical protein